MNEKAEADSEPDYMSPDFILQNLAITNTDCTISSTPTTILARDRMSKLIADQVCFYCMCILKGYIGCSMLPTILVVGSGLVGTSVVEGLVNCGCQEYIKVITRGDVAAKKWRANGIRSHENLERLMQGAFPDIVVICSSLSSFPSFCRQFVGVVSTATCVISTVFGLQRRRIYSIFRTPTVFRTYIEPERIIQLLDEKKKEINPPEPINIPVMSESLKKAIGSAYFEESTDDVLTSTGHHKHEVFDATDEEFDNVLELPTAEEAAHLISCRTHDMGNLIMLVENCFMIRGMPPALARKEAVASVLGEVDIFEEEEEKVAVVVEKKSSRSGFGKKNAPPPPPPNQAKKKSDELAPEAYMTLDPPSLLLYKDELCDVIRTIQDKIGRVFQAEFSRHVAAIDIPSAHDYTARALSSTRNIALIWPPLPVYFNNILDIYADRHKTYECTLHQPILLRCFDQDRRHMYEHSPGYALMHQMDEDSDDDNTLIDAPSAADVPMDMGHSSDDDDDDVEDIDALPSDDDDD